MPLWRNIAANYIGQGLGALLGLVMVPVYIHWLGAESYGLVGFFTMLQAWFQLLDFGLTPTLARELSRWKAGAGDGDRTANMVRALEWVFASLGLVSAISLGVAAESITHVWLRTQSIPANELVLCLWSMAGMIAVRWLIGLYRGGLGGMERMVALNVSGVTLAVIRAAGSWALLAFWTTRPSVFFLWQLVMMMLDLLVSAWLFYRAFPLRAVRLWPAWGSLNGLWRMAGSMAFLAGLWVMICQTDKLVLSWVLDLREYGCYMVAVMLAGGIAQLAAPLSQSLQPRFSVLATAVDRGPFILLYRASTQICSATVFGVAGALSCYAEPLLTAWTGNAEVARQSARVLPLYSIGNAIVVLLGLAFSVQFALGRTRWHVIGNCLFGVIWVPGVYIASRWAGAVGAGWVWLGGNLAFLLLWMPYVHRRILPELWWRWIVGDVGAPALAVLVGLLALGWVRLPAVGRIETLAMIGGLAVVPALAGVLVGKESRGVLVGVLRRFHLAPAAG